jgi:SAM-dependent methyltransferase
MTALFDPLAELYERYAEINDEVYRPWLTAALHVYGPRERAIDLGCGSGRFEGLLAERYRQVLAVDVAEREIELARTKRALPGVDYQVRSMLEVTPDRDGAFDLVFSVNALFHVAAQDGLLAHVRSLVRPGGWVILVDIVSRGPRALLVHRLWGVQDAARTLARRRSLADAWTVLRLRQHPVWMRHARANHPLTRPEFHRRYAAAFPGATFTDTIDPFVCAVRWQAPA